MNTIFAAALIGLAHAYSSGLASLDTRLVDEAGSRETAVATQADEIFANGFQRVSFAVPLASPDGIDDIYTASVTIGNQTFALDVDTGSTTLGVAGNGCSTCAGVFPDYVPSASATATGFTTSSQYADGTGWSGAVFIDAVGLGDNSSIVALDIADITHSSGFFDADNSYQGILGLGPQANAEPHTTGYVPTLVAAGVDDLLAFDLCDITGTDAGTMWIGEDTGDVATQYTPLVPITANNPFYAINVDALMLGSSTIVSNASATFAQPVVDTGTSLFYVPTSVYSGFRQALTTSSGFQATFGSKTFSGNGCVSGSGVTDLQVDAQLPHIALALPNTVSGQPDVVIQASALNTYLYNSGDGQYCLAIQNGGTVDPSTFGIAFMQAFHTVIDVSAQRVGFGPPTSCTTPSVHRVKHPLQTGPHRPLRMFWQ